MKTASENQRVQIDANIEEQRNEISRLETENETYWGANESQRSS